jgi:hypothetical protein
VHIIYFESELILKVASMGRLLSCFIYSLTFCCLILIFIILFYLIFVLFLHYKVVKQGGGESVINGAYPV